MDFVTESSGPGSSANVISVNEAKHEIVDYLHQNTAVVDVGDRASDGQHLADMGDTAAGVGA